MINYSVKPLILSPLIIAMFFFSTVTAQEKIKNNDGIIITEKGDVTVFYDEFTGEYTIGVTDTTLLSSLDMSIKEDCKSFLLPLYGGGLYAKHLSEFTVLQRWSDGFTLVIMRSEPKNYFFEDQGSKQIPFLIEGKRVTKTAHYLKRNYSEFILIPFTSSEWENIIKSESSRYRINGRVFTIDQNSKSLMEQILSEHQRILSDKEKSSTNNNMQRPYTSTPFDLQWEGQVDRSPMVQPLPSNPTNHEATITIRFEVNPDGSLGRVFPQRQMNPELEREVMRTLRSWRFSRLPSGVPQEPQWGTITFRFMID